MPCVLPDSCSAADVLNHADLNRRRLDAVLLLILLLLLLGMAPVDAVGPNERGTTCIERAADLRAIATAHRRTPSPLPLTFTVLPGPIPLPLIWSV